MKKYAIITEKDNAELLKKLIEAGFRTQNSIAEYYNTKRILSINFNCDRNVHWSNEMTKDIMQFYINERADFITTKQALAMLAAGEIDGQKQAWEVAKDGHRLVTDQERMDHDYPEEANAKWIECETGESWHDSDDLSCWNKPCYLSSGKYPCAFSVPSDYIFETDRDMKLNALNDKLNEMIEKQIEATEEIRTAINELK